MSECHVVHIGRDSRIQGATVEITLQKGVPSGEIRLSFSRSAKPINDVTCAHMTPQQADALARELLDAADEIRGTPKRMLVVGGFDLGHSPKPSGVDVIGFSDVLGGKKNNAPAETAPRRRTFRFDAERGD